MKDSVSEVKLKAKLINSMSPRELEDFKVELEGTCQALSYCINNCGHSGVEDLLELNSFFPIIDSKQKHFTRL